MIDLRSDTVTKPSPAMRAAMASAEVGDDVYGEDPTINKLEQRAAEIFEREAAIFVPTGTMGNQIAIKLHTKPGQEIICEERGHIFNYEMAMLAWFSGCMVRPVRAENGILTWAAIEPKIAGTTYYLARTGLVSLENTHNIAGGMAMPPDVFDNICDRAHAIGLPVHLDGARIFNAAVALGRPVAEITRKADSIMFCLSKGLGAPVGSLLVGNKDFITEARRARKALGGGMRQAGVLAGAGLIALEEGPKRLHEDHSNAQLLARGLADIEGIKLNLAAVKTNILVFDVSGTGMASSQIAQHLAERGVLAGSVNQQLMRMVTHLDVNRAACEKAVATMREVVEHRSAVTSHR